MIRHHRCKSSDVEQQSYMTSQFCPVLNCSLAYKLQHSPFVFRHIIYHLLPLVWDLSIMLSSIISPVKIWSILPYSAQRFFSAFKFSTSSSLIVSHTWLSIVGDRAFPIAAARVWNSLPQHVTSSPSVAVFQSHLKTHLFSVSYPTS